MLCWYLIYDNNFFIIILSLFFFDVETKMERLKSLPVRPCEMLGHDARYSDVDNYNAIITTLV